MKTLGFAAAIVAMEKGREDHHISPRTKPVRRSRTPPTDRLQLRQDVASARVGFVGRPPRSALLAIGGTPRRFAFNAAQKSLLESMNRGKYSQMKLARQIAALPVRYSHDGLVLVLLVTSRETARWVIPKGWPWPDCEEWISAAEEAREEAGVLGTIHPASIGSYQYDKHQPSGALAIHVTVFRLEVTEELATWPECGQRKRSWFGLMEAAAEVEEPDLQNLIRQLPKGAGTY